MPHPLIGATEAEQRDMLTALGFGSVDELFSAVVPLAHQFSGGLSTLGTAKTELELKLLMGDLASRNRVFEPEACFAGAGFYQRVLPAALQQITATGSWMTPYTPYQPEVSQGILLTLFDYQSMMARLSGMAVVNAGLYHGPNALVEGALMACRITKKNKVLVSDSVNPVAIRNMITYFEPKGLELVLVPSEGGLTTAEGIDSLIDGKTAAVVVQNPNFWGLIDGMDEQAGVAKANGALYMVYGGGDQISLGMLTPPGAYGADIYAGEGQHFGIPLGFGGPHIGPLGVASSDRKFISQLPGRLVGETKDIHGNPAYVLVLQTREQHIRRESATSNTCTAETLIAVMNSVYLALMSESGFKQASEQSYHIAHYLAKEIGGFKGFELLYPDQLFFNEFAVRTPVDAGRIVSELSEKGILPGVDIARVFPQIDSGRVFPQRVLLISGTEANNSAYHLDMLLEGLRSYGK